MYDVIVVGAGPAGLYSTRLIEKEFRVLVIEEDKEIGKPVQCSGLISRNLDRFIEIDHDFVENDIKGAMIHSGKNKIMMEKPGNVAMVIDRGKLDSFLAKGLESEIMLGSRVGSIDIRKDHVSVTVDNNEFRSKMLLGCDGPNSIVRNHFGIKPHEILKGLIAITKEEDKSDFVEIWLDKGLVPDGFMWKIPRGKSIEYGMVSNNSSFQDIENFFKLNPDSYEKRAGIIPIGLQKTYFPRTLLVGDAASQVKPWSGGGVVYGMTCARIASGVMKTAFERGDFSEGFLKRYEDEWKKEIGRNITFGLMFREFYKDLDQKGVERFIEKLRDRDIKRIDMDFPIGILD
jgi:geranylgeranyl reductase family protein